MRKKFYETIFDLIEIIILGITISFIARGMFYLEANIIYYIILILGYLLICAGIAVRRN